MRISILSITFLLLTVCVYAQTSHYVSLYPTPGPNRYTTVQAAVDASSAGDTVYVEPGEYQGSLQIDHDLIFIGPGWYQREVDSLTNTLTSRARLTSDLFITSDAEVGIHGMWLRGLRLRDSSSVTSTSTYYESIVYLESSRNAVFVGCVFAYFQSSGSAYALYKFGNVDMLSLTVSNCLFTGSRAIRSRYYASSTSQSNIAYVDFNNCVARGTVNITTGSVQNCILFSSLSTSGNPGLSASNCVFIGQPYTSSWGVPNSVWDVSEYAVFTRSGPVERFYQLKTTSPARGAGSNGNDAGLFGGPTPFVLSGIQNIPWIHQLNLTSQGSQGSGVDVNVKVRAQ